MEKPAARLGLDWVKQGFALFRQQPGELSSLFLVYMFLMLGVGVIPILGQLLPLMLAPAFTMAFMQACVMVEKGERVQPKVLFYAFRSPNFRTLLKLGAFYPLIAGLAFLASRIVDGGLLWQLLSGQLVFDPNKPPTAEMELASLAMMFAIVAYTLMTMVFWYAAPLIIWQSMGLFKAIFFSFFAVMRAAKAFLVYWLVWAGIGVFLPTFVSLIVATLFNNPGIAMLIMLPASMLLMVVRYCSFYPTYASMFGSPNDANATPGKTGNTD
jgi:hypothetical protein